jgi:CheY-like chemotaxis protein
MKKIVIINDNADFLAAMQLLLEQEKKYKPLVLHEGDLAYRKVKEEKPDLVILDIRMDSPTTGWKVLDLLTLDPETSAIPVIICSASAEHITPEKNDWLASHGIEVLPKPFDIDDLLSIVERMLSSRKRKSAVAKAN